MIETYKMNWSDLLEFPINPLKNLFTTVGVCILGTISETNKYYRFVKEIGIDGSVSLLKYKFRRCLLKYLEVDVGVNSIPTTNKYIVSYENNGKRYNILLNKKCKRPRNNIVLVTHLNQDVTDEFKRWFGPYYDFHGSTITPKDMGYGEIYVMLKDGTEAIVFREDEPINIHH